MNLIVPRVPEATPSFSLGTEPITALEFGDEKIPVPTPATNSLASTSCVGALVSRLLNKVSAKVMIAIPKALIRKEPNLSESHPLKGEINAIIKGITSRMLPA